MSEIIKTQCLVIGAGVVGSSIFNSIVKSGYSCIMVDKASDVSTGASKANSGLVHAGFDAVTGTLKAKLNVEGNKMYPAICKRLGLPLKKLGALVVGQNKEDVEVLYNRGLANGVKNMQILNREDLLMLEPNLADGILWGLYAKDAYIVSPYLFTISLAEEGVVNGGTVLLETNIKSVKRTKDGYMVSTNKGDILAHKIVNCAGAGFNDVAKILGTEQIPLTFRRGEYYVLDQSEFGVVNRTVFPLPSKKGKGTIVTPTIDGNILVGPTSYESDDSTKTTAIGLADIKEKVSSLVKNVNLKKTIRTFSGVRAISGDDFVIRCSQKDSNVVYAGGICSPGLSSAPAIAKMVIKLLGFDYNPDVKTKTIQPYFLLKDLPESKQKEIISKDKNFAKIVCKCEGISVGEILYALNRPIKVVSTDAIKRRVRVGMGRCQGGFCLDSTIELIAKKNKIQVENVLKENCGSNHIVGDIRKLGGK